MNVREIYEQLLEGNKIVLEFSSRNDYLSVYSQLRSIKSRFDASFMAVSGSTISGGKVIRTTRTVGDIESYTFSLSDRKVIEKIQFKILDIIPEEPVGGAPETAELPFDAQIQLEMDTRELKFIGDATEKSSTDVGNGNEHGSEGSQEAGV